ncbi:MAG: DUF2357 domain-containing protein, partial [Clostridia bacterium]|nr:DUF2357 domain-containing protein [Clostridia bacterium]
EITEDVFTDTINVNSSLIQRHAEYGELFNSFTGGEIRFIRKKQVRSVDERWVNAIEDCLPALDEVMRNPSHFIEETEELLPIERTKKVTTQSIKHLSQHTGLISRIENDVVIPSKLLNVFRDESVMTYENKFVNTLLIRLYNFVVGRYETASEYGANAEKYEFYFTDGVENDEERGKVSLKLEMIKPSEQAEKNRFFGSDLWERVKKLNGIITDYSKSDFAMQMGNVCIFPPVVRTNPILKNKNLHQCLELWEFLEGYDDGDGITVSEEEISAQDIQKEFARQGLAEQYLAFRKFVSAAGIGSAVEPSADAEDNFGAAETSEKPITAETAEESKYDELALLVDAALCAEEIALNEGKAKQDALRAEREELLRKQAEEESKEEFKEEIKSAVDTLPVEYPEYSYNETPSDGMISENGDTEENDGDKDDADVAKTEENGETVIYVKSFAAKLSFASERLKGYYCEIANAFLSRKGVRERTAFDHVDFYRGRKTLARVIIIGKSVRVFFALSPTEQDKKYRIVDKSSVKRYEATPSMVKVRGPLGLKHALELIDIVCDGLEKTALTAVRTVGDYPEKTFEEALDGGEIRRRVVSAPRGGLNAIRVMPHEDSVADEMVFRAVKEKPEYDYSEEAAAYLKEIEKKGGKKVVLKTVKSSDIAKAIKRVDEEETAAAAERENARKAEKAAEKVLI